MTAIVVALTATVAACTTKAPEPQVGDIAEPGTEVSGPTIVLAAFELTWNNDGQLDRVLRSATITYEGVTDGSADDFVDLLDADDLAELEPYDIAYAHFTVTMDDGALGNGQVDDPLVLMSFIDSTGAVASDWIWWMSDDAPGGCKPVSVQRLVTEGSSEGCEVLVLTKGAELDHIEYVGYTTSVDVADAPIVWRPTEE